LPTERRAIFLQVRLGSTRLPGKALLPLHGKPIIAWAMERLCRVDVDEYWLVADEESAAQLAPVASQHQYSVFGGDPTNVLKRFVDCARQARIDWIVRATGDNPLVAWELAEQSLAHCASSQSDYAGITGTPYGTGIEVCSVKALSAVHNTTRKDYDREHVTPGLYQNPERFKIHLEEAAPHLYLPDASVTIDTRADYQRMKDLFDHIKDPATITLEELVALLRLQARERGNSGGYSDSGDGGSVKGGSS